jgi:hypothetical protein
MRAFEELAGLRHLSSFIEKTLATDQAAALYAEESALGKIKSQLTAFRVK